MNAQNRVFTVLTDIVIQCTKPRGRLTETNGRNERE